MSKPFNLNVQSKMVNGEIYFTSTVEGVEPSELSLLRSVNLSRGGSKMYRLDQLANHNGSGANWKNRNDGVHSENQQYAYTSRVQKDIDAAWTASKAAIIAARNAKAAAAKAAADNAAFNTGYTTFFSKNGS